jgi:hypothetical protein
MIMEGILKNWKGFLNEEITSKGKVKLKYYSFDWDDNLIKMPTKILFKDVKNGGIKEVDTHSFAVIRSKLPELGLEYLPNEGSFINFRDNDKANEDFIHDAVSAPIAEAWPAFVRAINSASFFAIITARGHSPQTLRLGVKAVIQAEKEGISKEQLINSIKKYYEVTKIRLPTQDEDALINLYLSKCQFSPVSHPSIAGSGGNAAASPEKLKEIEFNKFKKKMQKISGKLRQRNKKLTLNDAGFLESHEFQIGFSDDDIKNVKHMTQATKNARTVSVFQTDETGVTKVK